jgi:hypothetical protein
LWLNLSLLCACLNKRFVRVPHRCFRKWRSIAGFLNQRFGPFYTFGTNSVAERLTRKTTYLRQTAPKACQFFGFLSTTLFCFSRAEPKLGQKVANVSSSSQRKVAICTRIHLADPFSCAIGGEPMHDLFRYSSFSPSWLTCRHHQGAIWSRRALVVALRTWECPNRRREMQGRPACSPRGPGACLAERYRV